MVMHLVICLKNIKKAENEAKKIKAGAWNGKFIFPWEWRKLKKNDKRKTK